MDKCAFHLRGRRCPRATVWTRVAQGEIIIVNAWTVGAGERQLGDSKEDQDAGVVNGHGHASRDAERIETWKRRAQYAAVIAK